MFVYSAVTCIMKRMLMKPRNKSYPGLVPVGIGVKD